MPQTAQSVILPNGSCAQYDAELMTSIAVTVPNTPIDDLGFVRQIIVAATGNEFSIQQPQITVLSATPESVTYKLQGKVNLYAIELHFQEQQVKHNTMRFPMSSGTMEELCAFLAINTYQFDEHGKYPVFELGSESMTVRPNGFRSSPYYFYESLFRYEDVELHLNEVDWSSLEGVIVFAGSRFNVHNIEEIRHLFAEQPKISTNFH